MIIKLTALGFRQKENPSIVKMDLKKGTSCRIYHDKDNQHSTTAIAVECLGHKIGFIPEKDSLHLGLFNIVKNDPITGYIHNSIRATEDFGNMDRGGFLKDWWSEVWVYVAIGDTLQSFNEDNIEILFDEEAHKYTYRGVELQGVSSYISQYVKKPNMDFIIPASSKSWGIAEEVISNAWDLNRELAQSFGTGVHKAIEFQIKYSYKYKDIKKKDGSNIFTLKNNTIANIVDNFFKMYKKLKFKGDMVSEAFITDFKNGLCGQSDLILVKDWKKKICRVQDFKVNHSVETASSDLKTKGLFGVAYGGKLDKIALQLSVYANMLQKSGWTVEGLDVFVLDDKWKHYELNVHNIL